MSSICSIDDDDDDDALVVLLDLEYLWQANIFLHSAGVERKNIILKIHTIPGRPYVTIYLLCTMLFSVFIFLFQSLLMLQMNPRHYCPTRS